MEPFYVWGKERERETTRRGRARFIGLGVLLGGALILLAQGIYDFSGSPRFCGNCHSMEGVHGGWMTSTHKKFGCTECHLPVGNVLQRFGYKARAGLSDLFHEVMRDYGIVGMLSGNGKGIVNDNCLRCHRVTVEATPMVTGNQSCLKCHRGLVHGRGFPKGV
jgi:cytochrome c nitrite reductase small subunit